MGWGQELQQPGVLDELYKYPWVRMAKPLTDNGACSFASDSRLVLLARLRMCDVRLTAPPAWKNMKGRVVKFLQELRAKRLGLSGAAREMDDLKTTKLWRYAANQRYGTT